VANQKVSIDQKLMFFKKSQNKFVNLFEILQKVKSQYTDKICIFAEPLKAIFLLKQGSKGQVFTQR